MKAVLVAMTVALVIGLAFVEVVNANPFSYPQSLPEVVISSDGTVNPPTDSINHTGNMYFLTRDVSGSYCIKILCSDIVFDGAGYSFVGGQFEKPTGILFSNVKNVSVRNIEVSNFFNGIYLSNSNNCLIENVNVSYCYEGLTLESSNFNQVVNSTVRNMYKGDFNGISLDFSDGNILLQNSLISNQYSIMIFNCQNNIICKYTIMTSIVAVNMMQASRAGHSTPSNNYIYLNSFINNSLPYSLMDLDISPLEKNNATGYFNYWSYDGYGNYYSDYQTKYPNAAEIGNTGIGDTPYFLSSNNIDSFPLVRILNIELSHTPLIPKPLPTPTPSSSIPATSSTPKVEPPSSSPSSAVNSSPNAPELSWIVLPTLAIATLFGTVALKKKTKC
jgi:parallel beta-helix repeat protein